MLCAAPLGCGDGTSVSARRKTFLGCFLSSQMLLYSQVPPKVVRILRETETFFLFLVLHRVLVYVDLSFMCDSEVDGEPRQQG